MIKRDIATRLPVLLVMLMVLGHHAAAEARQNKNDIEYWRANYPALQPADDPRVSQAQLIFQRLLQVTGRRPDVEPRLFFIKRNPWDLALPIALPRGWIILSPKVLDICYQEPEAGDDRLAFILAHEISHQLSGDLWHLRFFQAIEATSHQRPVAPAFVEDLQRGLSMTEHVLARELQADERGIIYAAMAGFDTQAIVMADDQVNFFVDWIRALNPDRIRGLTPQPLRPTPEERAAALETRLRQVVDQIAVFRAGLWWYYAGNYSRAIQAFDYFRGLYPGREVIHNLATSHHRLALQFYQAWKPEQPTIPFRLSMAIEPETRASRIELDKRTQASRGDQAGEEVAKLFRAHLDQSIDGYAKARQLDDAYIPSALNLSSALILRSLDGQVAHRQSDLARAIMTLSQALERQPREAQIHTNLGVAYFYDGQLDRAKTSLIHAQRLSPNDAALNYNLTLIAHMDQHPGDDKRSRRDSKPQADHAATEQVQELTIGDIVPASWFTRQQSRFELDGRQYILGSNSATTMTLTQDDEVLMVMARPGYQGRSANGIRIGSRELDVLAAYGDPLRRLETTQGHNWSYDQHRIAFQIEHARVVSWLIY